MVGATYAEREGTLDCSSLRRPGRSPLPTHARCTVFQMTEVALPRDLFRRILEMIEEIRPRRWSDVESAPERRHCGARRERCVRSVS